MTRSAPPATADLERDRADDQAMVTTLTTVVVNWNTAELLDECFASIVAATPPGVHNEIVLVDNASADDSVALTRHNWPDVRVIVNEHNEGFCRANNIALRQTDSEFVLLVNTDARLRPGSVATMLRYFADDPRAGAVGPRLEYADGSFQRWTAGRALNLASAATYLLMLDRLTPGGTGGMYLGRDRAEAFQPGWVSSAVMALRRSALDEVGLLDDKIFVYMDDVDLCDRLTARKWHVWYAPDTTATHFMGASSVNDAGARSPEALRALNRWFARRHGMWQARLLQGVEVVGFGMRVTLYAAKTVLHPSAAARAGIRTHLAHLRLAMEPIRV